MKAWTGRVSFDFKTRMVFILVVRNVINLIGAFSTRAHSKRESLC